MSQLRVSDGRICVRCGSWYVSGTYRLHRTTHQQAPDRRCTICHETYQRGSWYTHSLTHPPSLTSERNADIVAALRADPDLTLTALAAQYGLTRERVRQVWTRATGQSAVRKHRDPSRACGICGTRYLGSYGEHVSASDHTWGEWQYLRNREIVALYEDGLSSVQIGRAYNLRATYVGELLRRHHVKMRSLKGKLMVRQKDVPRG